MNGTIWAVKDGKNRNEFLTFSTRKAARTHVKAWGGRIVPYRADFWYNKG